MELKTSEANDQFHSEIDFLCLRDADMDVCSMPEASISNVPCFFFRYHTSHTFDSDPFYRYPAQDYAYIFLVVCSPEVSWFVIVLTQGPPLASVFSQLNSIQTLTIYLYFIHDHCYVMFTYIIKLNAEKR
jgi:hypothetical protein